MKNKLFFLFALVLFNTSFLSAQDLIQKVPQDASVVLTFNNKAFFDHIGIEGLNATLTKFNFFEKIFRDSRQAGISKLQDLGIDYQSKSYSYYKMTDSVYFIGALIPLSNAKQFESILSKEETIEMVNNLPTLYSKDRTLRISWDSNTLYILGAMNAWGFFDNREIMERYGLQSAYEDYDSVSVAEDAEALSDAEEVIWEEWEGELDTTEEAEEVYIEEEEDEYAIVDSILAQEEYADDYYSQYDSIRIHNDSIKNALLADWLNTEFGHILSGKYGSYSSKKLKPLSNNTLIQVYTEDFTNLSSFFYGAPVGGMGYLSSLYGFYLFNENRKRELDFGVKSMLGQIDILDNKIKMHGDVTLDKSIAKRYQSIYKKGVNPKFYPHLNKDVLAFMSVNINTEAYLKNLPDLVNQYYGQLFPKYAEHIALSMSIFDVLLDDKAIGKVYKGDNLLLLNGVTKSTVKYTGYDYDEDYNYIEVEKTKEETLPQFLWMFSSEDTKIFEQLIKLGLKENAITDLGGIYSSEKVRNSDLQVYFQIKNGIVFVGNDLEKMNAIKNNQQGKPYAPYVSLAKKNVAAFVFNTSRVPVLLNELDIPVQKSYMKFVEELNQYGDVSAVSKGIVGDTFKSEATVEFPKGKGNALQFLLNLFDR